jgi:murein DD-endopeptidase MepM/ murein hydrolase activator NlpD
MVRIAAKPALAKAALVLLLLVPTRGTFSATQQVALKSQIRWQPSRPVSGSPILFQVSALASAQLVSAVWMNHEVIFFRSAKTNFWCGLAGVSLETAPGTYDLRLTETLAGGKSVETLQRIKIARAVYPKITVKVAKQYTEPSPEQLAEISADKNVKQTVFGAGAENPQRLWTGRFAAPVEAPVSDVFGTARVFNQQIQSRHQGLDYAAPSGTPVHAVNRGTVILARPLFFEGNCVVVDHGQGLLSLYLHLSEFKVKEGEEIQEGQVIALSGDTGRASGPHLHLAIRWHGVYLDPAILMKLKVPGD